jgi:hypothetical protein
MGEDEICRRHGRHAADIVGIERRRLENAGHIFVVQVVCFIRGGNLFDSEKSSYQGAGGACDCQFIQ